MQELQRVNDYIIKYKVLNAANYGVPQKRTRLIVTGIQEDLFLDFNFPKITHGNFNAQLSIKDAINDIIDFPFLNIKEEKYDIDEKENCIYIIDINGFIREKRTSDFLKMHPPLDLNKPSKTLLTKPDCFLIPFLKYNGITVYRKLTVKEFLRIQTFPDWWEYPKRCPVSERYKLIGEAVPPILAYRLAEMAAKILRIEPEKPKKEIFDLPFFDKIFNNKIEKNFKIF
jgi:DNA (cytosine-5)-methyltransferase 1